MAYCHKGPDSDVYLFRDTRGGFTCCCCWLRASVGEGEDAWNVRVPSLAAALAHLEAHVQAGHQVPAGALERLRAELARGTAG